MGVFEAARILDDAVLYYQVSLSDRRISAVLLAGVDLILALKDRDAGSRGEQVLRHAEGLIERAKRGRERIQQERVNEKHGGEKQKEEEEKAKEDGEQQQEDDMLVDEVEAYENVFGAANIAFKDEPNKGGDLIMSPLSVTQDRRSGGMEVEELESDVDK